MNNSRNRVQKMTSRNSYDYTKLIIKNQSMQNRLKKGRHQREKKVTEITTFLQCKSSSGRTVKKEDN